jgi:NMD protein affecting ribosome stability and mRNA decay
MGELQREEGIIGQLKNNQMILKQCFICGKKTNELFEGKCENCLKQNILLIKQIKESKFFICNHSKKICYKNSYYTKEDFLEILPKILKKNIVLNDEYKLNKIEIEDFEIDGHKLVFDANIDYSFVS